MRAERIQIQTVKVWSAKRADFSSFQVGG